MILALHGVHLRDLKKTFVSLFTHTAPQGQGMSRFYNIYELRGGAGRAEEGMHRYQNG